MIKRDKIASFGADIVLRIADTQHPRVGRAAHSRAVFGIAKEHHAHHARVDARGAASKRRRGARCAAVGAGRSDGGAVVDELHGVVDDLGTLAVAGDDQFGVGAGRDGLIDHQCHDARSVGRASGKKARDGGGIRNALDREGRGAIDVVSKRGEEWRTGKEPYVSLLRNEFSLLFALEKVSFSKYVPQLTGFCSSSRK